MKLGLVIDLDTCVGCHACAVACKQWNTSGTTGPLTDTDPYGAEPSGVWFNRIRHYEAGEWPDSKTVNVPMSCMHCEEAACVTVCPTGASWKRDDGIVLVDQSKCMGCNLCAWACPYGARELDPEDGVMKKCTLCVDRIHDQALPEAERQPVCVLTCPTSARLFGDLDDPESEVSRRVAEREGVPLMPELGYAPVNRYLPPRARPEVRVDANATVVGDPVASARSGGGGSTEPEAARPEAAGPGPREVGSAGLLAKWMRRQKDAFDRLGQDGR